MRMTVAGREAPPIDQKEQMIGSTWVCQFLQVEPTGDLPPQGWSAGAVDTVPDTGHAYIGQVRSGTGYC